MPKLPELQQRSIPNAVLQPAGAVDNTAQIKADDNLGKALEKAGGAIYQIDQQQDMFSYNSAKSDFYRKQIELNDSIESEPDYQKRVQLFDKGMDSINSGFSKSLGDNRYKGTFQDNVFKVKNTGRQKLLATAKIQQTAQNIATAAKIEETNLDLYNRTNDPDIRNGLLKSSVDTFSAALPLDDPQRDVKIAEYKQRVGERFAMHRLNDLPVDDQIAVLTQDEKKMESNFAKHIPADKRQLLLQKAEYAKEQQRDLAVAAVEKNNKRKKQNANNGAFKIVNEGGTVAQVPPEMWFNLDEKTREDLNTLQLQRAGSVGFDKVKSQIAYNDYFSMYANNPKAMGDVNPIDIQTSVTPDMAAQVMKWREDALQGKDAPATFGVQNTILTQSYKTLGIKSDTDQAKFSSAYITAIDAFEEINGKEPTIDELRSISNDLIAKVSVEGFLYGTNKEPIYKVEKDTKLVVPDAFANQLLLEAKEAGMEFLTPEQISAAYNNSINDVR